MKIVNQILSSKNSNELQVTENSTCLSKDNKTKEELSINCDEQVVKGDKSSEEEKIAIKPERRTVCISKLGSDHEFANQNNQDFTFNLLNMKVVTDGCSSGKHSEVGTHIFAQLFARQLKEISDEGIVVCGENIIEIINKVFEKMLSLCNDINFIFQNYCFTILICFEFENEFVVYSCGDGYIITETKDGINFEELDDGEYPCYYVYNFIEDKNSLKEYKDGVEFKVNRYSKEDYINVGVASDGLKFWENLLEVEKNELINSLLEGKGSQIEKLINRNNNNYGKFHDDISICF